MSGGSWDHVYRTFLGVAEELLEQSCPYRRALARIVLETSMAMRDIEWVDSGDLSPGDEIESIKKLVTQEHFLKVVVADAKKVQAQLNEILEKLETPE